jgi:hypothetical protein
LLLGEKDVNITEHEKKKQNMSPFWTTTHTHTHTHKEREETALSGERGGQKENMDIIRHYMNNEAYNKASSPSR